MTKEELRLKVLELAVGSVPGNFSEHLPRAKAYLEFVSIPEDPKELEPKELKSQKKSDNPKVLP